MIGQSKVLNDLLLIADRFPRFVLLLGTKHSGKKLLALTISTSILKLPYVTIESGVEEIRGMKQTALQYRNGIVYIIPDIEEISGSAANALLKILEEPPKKAYFIATASNKETVLPTILSRADSWFLNNYTPKELDEYIKILEDKKDKAFSVEEKKILKNTCSTPGMINLICQYDIIELYEYAEKIINNIYKVSGANALKAIGKLKLKADDDGYELEPFFRIILSVLVEKSLNAFMDNPEFLNLCKCITATIQLLNKLYIKGIHKTALVDDWILVVRKIYQEEGEE